MSSNRTKQNCLAFAAVTAATRLLAEASRPVAAWARPSVAAVKSASRRGPVRGPRVASSHSRVSANARSRYSIACSALPLERGAPEAIVRPGQLRGPVHLLRDPYRLGALGQRVVELPERAQRQGEQPANADGRNDRREERGTRRLIGGIRGQGVEGGSGHRDARLIVAGGIGRTDEIVLHPDPQRRFVGAAGWDRQGTVCQLGRRPVLPDGRVGIAHGRHGPGHAFRIAERRRLRLGVSIVVERALDVAAIVEHRAELELHVDNRDIGATWRRELPRDVQCLGVAGHRLPYIERAAGARPPGSGPTPCPRPPHLDSVGRVNTLLFRAEGLQIAVARDGRAQLVPVTIGRDYGTTVEIAAGLQPTDQVIVAPSDSLISGTPVRIAGAPAGARP